MVHTKVRFRLPGEWHLNGRTSVIVNSRTRELVISERPMSPVRHDAWSTVETRQRHRLIADNALCTIAGRGVDSPQVGVRFGAGDKECASVVQREEPLEIEVAPIHDVNGRRFRNQKIERIDIVHLAVGNMYKTRDVSTQVQKRMHFDRCFGASKRRPWEQRKAQVDGRGVECINRIREIETQVFFGVKLAGLGNESLRKLGIDSPVSSLVGVGQRRAPDRRPNTHVIKLGRLGRETSLDIAQTRVKLKSCVWGIEGKVAYPVD